VLRWLAGWSIESPSKTCSFERETEQVRVSAEVAKLGLLADNAGPADTHGLTPGSVAIDEDAMVKLQTTGVSVGEYLAVFRSWEESGEMAFYRAHFILDDVHWIWYAGLFTTVLCRLFDRHGVGHKYDWVLLLPLGSGLLDWYENQLQHVFLSASDFATIVDPLPLFSTVASDVKWLFSAIYILLTIVLAVGIFLKGRGNKGINKQ
jgi:hypothetical protein